MRPDDIDEVAERLNEWGIKFVVVGGSALEREYRVGSGDVDLLLAVGQFPKLEEALSDRAGVEPLEVTGTIATSRFAVGGARVEVEFIKGSPFSGERSGDQFVAYVGRYASRTRNGVQYATPAVVWYMRLAFDDQWELFVQKIARDVRSGVPESTLEEVQRLANHFGVGEKYRHRIAQAREYLRLRR